MAAITSTVLAVGGLGLSAAQAVKANKDKQSAVAAAAKAAAAVKAVDQQNAFKSLQAPDVKSMMEQRNLQSQALTVGALQEMGTEGAAQIANVYGETRESNLEATETQSKLNYQRDLAEAGAQQRINEQQAATERNLELMRLEGAQGAVAQAEANRNAAIQGMFGATSGIVEGLGKAVSLYGKSDFAERVRNAYDNNA
jgi:hypothetical protein